MQQLNAAPQQGQQSRSAEAGGQRDPATGFPPGFHRQYQYQQPTNTTPGLMRSFSHGPGRTQTLIHRRVWT
eukprot:11057013-Prorocentrum_lima.AAC.1